MDFDIRRGVSADLMYVEGYVEGVDGLQGSAVCPRWIEDSVICGSVTVTPVLAFPRLEIKKVG